MRDVILQVIESKFWIWYGTTWRATNPDSEWVMCSDTLMIMPLVLCRVWFVSVSPNETEHKAGSTAGVYPRTTFVIPLHQTVCPLLCAPPCTAQVCPTDSVHLVFKVHLVISSFQKKLEEKKIQYVNDDGCIFKYPTLTAQCFLLCHIFRYLKILLC